MPWYRKARGKVARPLSDFDFKKGMESGHFCRENHRAYCVLLWYSAVRKMEALRALREQFTISGGSIYFEVGDRLKKQKAWLKKTEPLPLPRNALFMDVLERAIRKSKAGKKVFPFSPRTAYNVVSRVWEYPHLFRLSRITWFFEQKYSIAQIRSWTGLSLTALEYYLGLVGIKKMGEGLANGVSKT